jgi:hypothetical protein
MIFLSNVSLYLTIGFGSANKGKLYFDGSFEDQSAATQKQQQQRDESVPDILHVSAMFNSTGASPSAYPVERIRPLHTLASKSKQNAPAEMRALLQSFDDAKHTRQWHRDRKNAMMNTSAVDLAISIRQRKERSAVVDMRSDGLFTTVKEGIMFDIAEAGR